MLLALSLQAQGLADAAVETYRALTLLKPASSLHWNNLGTALRGAGRNEDAQHAYREALRLSPHDIDASLHLAYLEMECGWYAAARDLLLEVHRKSPNLIQARLHGARMCYELGENEHAQSLIRDWARWQGLADELMVELGVLLIRLGDVRAGSQILEGLLDRPAVATRARVCLAGALERTNRLDEAMECSRLLPQAAELVDPAVREEAVLLRARLARRKGDLVTARRLLEYLSSVSKDPGIRRTANPYFLLAKVCDEQADADAAMSALATAHAIQLKTAIQVVPEMFAPGAEPLAVANIWLQADDLQVWPDLACPSMQESPIFVVGFPRSGTTMLEQMLDAHPLLRSMDERPFLQILIDQMGESGLRYPEDLDDLNSSQCDDLRAKYWNLASEKTQCGSGQRLVDKNPLNLLRLPLIRRLFPNARILFMQRHPCDVVLSCYMQGFRFPAFVALCSSLERLARGYVNAIRSWQYHLELLQPNVHVVRYEQLLKDPTNHARQIGSFLELEDPAQMLNFHIHARGKAYISTPSYEQVVEPLNTKAVGRWHRYRHHLGPILPILEPIIAGWDYDA